MSRVEILMCDGCGVVFHEDLPTQHVAGVRSALDLCAKCAVADGNLMKPRQLAAVPENQERTTQDPAAIRFKPGKPIRPVHFTWARPSRHRLANGRVRRSLDGWQRLGPVETDGPGRRSVWMRWSEDPETGVRIGEFCSGREGGDHYVVLRSDVPPDLVQLERVLAFANSFVFDRADDIDASGQGSPLVKEPIEKHSSLSASRAPTKDET